MVTGSCISSKVGDRSVDNTPTGSFGFKERGTNPKKRFQRGLAHQQGLHYGHPRSRWDPHAPWPTASPKCTQPLRPRGKSKSFFVTFAEGEEQNGFRMI